MRITRITKTLLVAVSLVFLPAKASDFGVWTGLGATKKVGMFSFTLDGGFRSQNNLKSVDRWNVGFGVEYKPSAYFSVATSYDFLYNYKCESKEAKYDTWIEKDDDGNEYTEKEYKGYNVKKPYWRCKNRWNFDLTGKLPIGRLTLSLRERYQFTRANSVSSLVDKYRVNLAGDVPEYKKTDVKVRSANNDSRLRSRLMADYDIRHCPILRLPTTCVAACNLRKRAWVWERKLRLTNKTNWMWDMFIRIPEMMFSVVVNMSLTYPININSDSCDNNLI